MTDPIMGTASHPDDPYLSVVGDQLLPSGGQRGRATDGLDLRRALFGMLERVLQESTESRTTPGGNVLQEKNHVSWKAFGNGNAGELGAVRRGGVGR